MGPIKYSFSFETYCRYYIIKDVQPLSCVEKAGFQQLIGILAPGLKVRGRKFNTNMLKDRYAEKVHLNENSTVGSWLVSLQIVGPVAEKVI